MVKKKKEIPATKKLGKELLKEAGPEHKLRVCAYVRVSTDTEEQLESFNAQIGRYTRIICENHKDDWKFIDIYSNTESGTYDNHECTAIYRNMHKQRFTHNHQ